jgi:serine phosphatase RsbU (regulator of sigma subunit)
MAHTEKRKYPRHYNTYEIMFSHYHKNPYSYYGAQIQNYSLGGMYFVSNYALQPGSVIYIKKAKYVIESIGPKAKEDNWVSVAWCRRIKDFGDFGYGIGVKNLNPALAQGEENLQAIVEAPDPLKGTIIEAFVDPLDIPCENPVCGKIQQELEHAREIAEARAKELATLNRFASAVSSTLDLKEILKTICRELVQIFGARNTGIGLLNRDKTKLRVVAFHSVSDEENDATGLEIPLAGNAATVFVIEHGETIIVPDAQHNPITSSYHDIALSRGTQCIMIVPLLARGEVIGTIGLPTSDVNRVYTSSDVSLAQTIASQISSTIQNARLYEETEKAKDMMEQELRIGRDIQFGFLPETLPDIPGWEISSHFKAAHMVAGDFYDIFTLMDGKMVGFVIGDVCDKGAGAALFMALFRTLIRAFAIQEFTSLHLNGGSSPAQPDEILKRTIGLTNDYIAGTHGATNMFATVFFGILDPATGSLAYLNSGHQAPVVIGRNTIRARLYPTGPAVGMFPDLKFGTNQVELAPEDILFTYTDGLTDAQNQEGEFFSEKRLLKLLTQPFRTAGQMLNHIVTDIDRHVSGTDQFDDITIMVVRRMKDA